MSLKLLIYKLDLGEVLKKLEIMEEKQ